MEKILETIYKELNTKGVSQKRIRNIMPTKEDANTIIDIFDKAHTLKYVMDSDFEYRYHLAPYRTIKEAEEEISQLLQEKEELAKERKTVKRDRLWRWIFDVITTAIIIVLSILSYCK